MSETLSPSSLLATPPGNLSIDSHLDRRPTNEYPQTPDVLDNNSTHGKHIRSDYVNSLHRNAVDSQYQSQSQGQAGGSGSSHPLTSTSPNFGTNSYHDHATTPQRVTRAFGLRVIRTVRRGQLPFLLVFFTCVIIFFSALSGLGYEEAPSTLAEHEREFAVGKPVFDGNGVEEHERVEKMKRLEEQWAKQKRPKDGAWMKSNRNQREVRRKPLADSRFQRQRQQEEPDLEHQQQPPQQPLGMDEDVEQVLETRPPALAGPGPVDVDGEDGLGDGDEGEEQLD